MSSEPLPYHLKIRDHFKELSGVWAFFSATGEKEEQLASLKSELLKNAYPFEKGSDPLLYEKINIIRNRLGLGHVTVTAYHASHSSEPQAGIVCHREEAHIVFSEEILRLLNEQELTALIAYELAHLKFYSLLNGDLEITDRIITALAGSPVSEAAHLETVRLFRIYKDIYCDRAVYEVLGEEAPFISMLLKCAKGGTMLRAQIRVQAFHLWRGQLGDVSPGLQEGGTKMEAAIAGMVEGAMELDRLDVLAQASLSEMTRELLIGYLRPEWMGTPVVLALAHQYFPDLEVVRDAGDIPELEKGKDTRHVPDKVDFPGKLKSFLADAHDSIREYFVYVLLDFALADPKLKEVSLGHAREMAENLGLTTVLEPVLKKEMIHSDNAY